MIKMTFCLTRRPDLTWQEFSAYWRDVHAPLVAERAELLRIRRYVQVRTVQDEALHEAYRARNGGSPAPYDGIAELWFDDLASMRSTRDERASVAARELLEDERRFIDLPRSPIWLGEEWGVVGPT
jgi:uncharacterized protein (TIGR02118 family)